MQIDLYNKIYKSYFSSVDFLRDFHKALAILRDTRNIFFIGNGGSNAICSHMMEDFSKIGGFRAYGFSDPALITCFSNDFGYDKAMEEWLKIYFEPGDLLVAVSSSGNSANIVNAVNLVKQKQGRVVTLSGFEKNNKLVNEGEVNFHIEVSNYGIVECFHQVILHALLDEFAQNSMNK